MFEEFIEILLGPWGLVILGIVALPDGRKLLRKTAKGMVWAGVTASEQVEQMAAQVRERASDLMIEMKHMTNAVKAEASNNGSKTRVSHYKSAAKKHTPTKRKPRKKTTKKKR